MAIYKNARLLIGGTNISSDVRAVSLSLGAETPDETAMGDTTRTMAAGGLLTWSIEGEANQVYGSSIDAVFATNVGQSVAVIFRHTSTATGLSTAVPKYSGNGVVSAYTPAGGSVGDQHTASFSIVANGALTRTVST